MKPERDPPPWDAARSARRGVLWLGPLLIAAIVALAVFDIVRSYRATVERTAQELDTQARIIAEQTARSVQAVAVVLRHLDEQHRHGALDALGAAELHAYLREQAVGLVQIDGLVMVDAQGRPRATSFMFPLPDGVNVADLNVFRKVRADKTLQLAVDPATQGLDGVWVLPIVRRLETPDGAFAGAIGARGRVEYFQDFYRDIHLEPGTTTTLMHRDGSLVARHPPAPGAIGQRYALFDELLAAYGAGRREALRTVSPIDGVERFGAVQAVPDYPLAVVVTRDAAAALADWRAQAIGSAARTLALAALAAALLALAMRHFARLDAARRSLEQVQERFALAVAGSDDGLWDWNYAADEAFASQRARAILGLPPGPELQTVDAWYEQIEQQLHPDDVPARRDAIEAHLRGETPAYEGEYRVRAADGSYRWIRARGMCVRDSEGRPLRIAGSVSDIDARKRAEDALRVSEERYALAMTGSTGGHWVWDARTDELYASGTLNQLFGLPPGTALATRADYFRRVRLHPDDVAMIARINEEVRSGRSPRVDFEYRILVPGSDEPRWILNRAQTFCDADGKVARVAGVSVDISERKRTEQALRESEERYALAVAGSNDGVLDWDIVHDRMFASPRAMRIAGVPVEERTCTRSEWVARLQIHPDDVQRHAEDFRRHLEGESEVREGEYRVRHADGVYRWVRVRGTSVRDAAGRAVRWAGSVSDIDAQKRTEQALRQSEERYQLAVAGSNEGLWDWDMRSDLLFVSARAQSLLGMEPGEPLRPRDEWIAACGYHPDDAARVRRTFSDHLHGRTPHFSCEYRMRHASGEWHWYRQRGVAVRDAEGRPYRVAGSMEDVTDRHHAEAARERLEAQLRQAQKLEAIGTLAGGIAHDFNNILAAILGYGEMVQRAAAEGSAQRRHIDAAMSAAMRAKSLVERILAFSRSGVGERVPVHVQSVVDEALNLIAASLPPGVRLERQLDAGDAAVQGDPTQIHQVVMNLCANAAQAVRGAGTITVRLERVVAAEPQVVTTHTLPPGRYLRLSVRDSGVGIAPKVLERIFDPFFTTREVGVGTGLGLSLVHGIVTELGGGIDVHSEPGHGSAFAVVLPWQGTAAAARADLAPPPAGNGETVLLVDDEEPLVRMGEEMMAQLGYEPVGFASSAAALASFRATPERFQAVVTDEAMPEMTGSELAREIRRLRADIPIVLMSGYVTPALAARAREVGAIEVLAKPLALGDIARSLAGALQR